MTRRPWQIPVIACLLICCSLVWTSSAAAQGMQTWTGPKTPVKLGVTGRPDSAFLMLALQRGYFDQHGIQIETVTAGSGNEFVAPLAQNRIQVASGSLNAALFNALNRGIDIRIVADFAHLGSDSDGLVSIMARTDLMDLGAIRSPADLKGKEISLGFGRGHYSYLMARTMLAKADLTFSDVTLRNMSIPNSLVAMSNRVIDAGFLIEPLVTAALRQNIARILVKGGTVEPGAQLSVLVYSPEFAKQPDAATRFLIAYLRGARDYHELSSRRRTRTPPSRFSPRPSPSRIPRSGRSPCRNTSISTAASTWRISSDKPQRTRNWATFPARCRTSTSMSIIDLRKTP